MTSQPRGARRLRWRTILFAAWLLFSGCPGDDDDDDDSVDTRVMRALAFSGGDGGQPIYGDLYLPAGQESPAVVLMVHGGAFKGGSRDELAPLAELLQDDGLAVFNVDYRLLEAGGEFPGALLDVMDASRYLAANDELPVDGICAGVGISGGATLLALAAGHRDDPLLARAGWPSSSGYGAGVDALVGMSGLYDFRTREEQHGELPWWESDWLGGLPGEISERYEYASAVTSAGGLGGPALLLHGQSDEAVEWPQSQDMADALAAAGVSQELVLYAEGMHGFLWPMDDTNPDGLDALARMKVSLHDACDDGAAAGTRGELVLNHTGGATASGDGWLGVETFVVATSAGVGVCSREYATEIAIDASHRWEVLYTLSTEEGDCEGLPGMPVSGESLSYQQGTDTRDGQPALFLLDDTRGPLRWFTLDSGGSEWTYLAELRLAPAFDR